MNFDRFRLNRLFILTLVAAAGIFAALWFQGSATAPGTEAKASALVFSRSSRMFMRSVSQTPARKSTPGFTELTSVVVRTASLALLPQHEHPEPLKSRVQPESAVQL